MAVTLESKKDSVKVVVWHKQAAHCFQDVVLNALDESFDIFIFGAHEY